MLMHQTFCFGKNNSVICPGFIFLFFFAYGLLYKNKSFSSLTTNSFLKGEFREFNADF